MLPPAPPAVSNRDFDPADVPSVNGDMDIDVEQEEEEEPEDVGSRVELSSVEINILIYLYLLESNLSHTAFTLLSESSLPSTSLFQHFNPSYPTPSTSSLSSAARIKPTSNSSTSAANGTNANPSAGGDKDKDGAPVPGSGRSATGQRAGHKYGSAEGRVPRGELIRKLWKGLRWEEVERHVSTSGESYKPACPNPFHLLIPHSCPPRYPSAINNPPLPLPAGLHLSPTPAKRPEIFPPPSSSDDGAAAPRSNKRAAVASEAGAGPEAEAEAGPSRTRPRTSIADARSDAEMSDSVGSKAGRVGGKRKGRVGRISSDAEDEDEQRKVRRSASPDLDKRKEGKRDRERERGKDRDGEKEIRRPRVSETDSDSRASKKQSRTDDRNKEVDIDPERSRPAASALSGTSTSGSGKDKDKIRDRDKERKRDKDRDKGVDPDKRSVGGDSDRERTLDKDKDKVRDRVSSLSGVQRVKASGSKSVSGTDRRSDTETTPARRKGAEDGSSGDGDKKRSAEREKRSGDERDGSVKRERTGESRTKAVAVNGSGTKGSDAESTPAPPASRGPGRPPKNPAPAPTSESRPSTSGSVGQKRQKTSAVDPSASPAPSTTALARKGADKSGGSGKVNRGKGKPDWISDNDVSVFVEHQGAVLCLAWNPRNPDVLASGSADGTARTWEFTHASTSADAAAVSGGDVDMDATEREASASRSPGHALQLSSDPQIMRHSSIDTSRKTICAIEWHPEGSMLATGLLDGVGRLITPDGHIHSVMAYGTGTVNTLKFSPSGRWILMAKADYSVCLWSVGVYSGGTQVVKCCYDAHSEEVNDVDWLDDDVFASGGNDHRIYVFRTSDKFVRYTFRGHTDDVTRVKWSPVPVPSASSLSTSTSSTQTSKANHLLASVSDDGYLMVWRMPSYPSERASTGTGTATNTSRSVSPNKGGAGGGGGDRTNLSLSLNVNEDERTSRGPSRDRDSKDAVLEEVYAGRKSNGGGRGGSVPVTTTTTTGQGNGNAAGPGTAAGTGRAGLPDHCVARMMVVDGENKRLSTLEWAPSVAGEMIVAAGAEDSTVKLFNALTGDLLFTLPGLESGVRCLTFSRLLGDTHDRLMLAAAGWSGQVYIYDARTGAKKGEWAFEEQQGGKRDPGIRAMTWREDGKHLAICNGNKAVALIYTGNLISGLSGGAPQLMAAKEEAK